jgi:hypothetical protein
LRGKLRHYSLRTVLRRIVNQPDGSDFLLFQRAFSGNTQSFGSVVTRDNDI